MDAAGFVQSLSMLESPTVCSLWSFFKFKALKILENQSDLGTVLKSP